MDTPPKPKVYKRATGGWGSMEGMAKVAFGSRPGPAALATLAVQNKPGGYMCSSCAWGKPPNPHTAEFCENGAKATIWDLTPERCTSEFFAAHSVTELQGWEDYDLEKAGRLTEPMRYDAASDRYVPVGWDEAIAVIGQTLQRLEPRSVTFYASGKAALEPSYLYGLFARMYGHNNLPDSSNMCHETTSVGLKKVIGSPVSSCTFDDLAHCDAIFYLGQNPGTNSPRILHPLNDAVDRGCKIVAFNPLREKGLLEFTDPQSPWQMTLGKPTAIAHQYLQLRPGSDIAALVGVCKRVLERDAGSGDVLDHAFLAEHTHGLGAFLAKLEATSWDAIMAETGLSRAALEQAGDVYAEAKNVIGIYGMGLTQQVHGSESIGMLVNLLLLRGNMGRQGAGIQPIRGHSNVQGQRTVGITEKPELVPYDKLKEIFGFDPPMEQGHTTVEFCEALLSGEAKGYIGLGGNLARAIPDQSRVLPAWRAMELTAHIATRLNRTHLLPGKQSYLLPCLVRAEEDMQGGENQTVTIEDSFSHIYGSIGKRTPAGENLRSETAIVAGMAKATLPAHPLWRWDEWAGDYGKIRDLIARTYPEQFRDMSGRMNQPGGFYRGNPAHDRIWKTQSGKAEFTDPSVLNAGGKNNAVAPGRYTLITLRSNDQFNTTIYGHDDRLRGLSGSRMIVLMSPKDMVQASVAEGQMITLVTDCDDGVHRSVLGLAVTPYDLPSGCLAGYFPELNDLVPLGHHDHLSKTPASKGIPVKLLVEEEPIARG